MPKAWYSVPELVGLPGMPTTAPGVRHRVKKEAWLSRPRQGAKGLECHISCFPPEAQAHLGYDPESLEAQPSPAAPSEDEATSEPIASSSPSDPGSEASCPKLSASLSLNPTPRRPTPSSEKYRGALKVYLDAPDTLPLEERLALFKASGSQLAAGQFLDPKAVGVQQPRPLSKTSVWKNTARLYLLKAQKLAYNLQIDKTKGRASDDGELILLQDPAWLEAYRTGLLGALGVPDWVFEVLGPSVGYSTWKTWWARYRDGNLEGKWQGWCGPRSINDIPGMEHEILVWVALLGVKAVSPKFIHAMLPIWAGPALEQAVQVHAGGKWPSYVQIKNWIKYHRNRHKRLWAMLSDPEKARSKYAPAIGHIYNYDAISPNEVWELDSSPLDLVLFKDQKWVNRFRKGKITVQQLAEVLTAQERREALSESIPDETPELARYCVVFCIDAATRRCKIRLSPTSNSEAILLLLGDCIREWGVPKSVRTDNGKDYISNRTQTFLRGLGVETEGFRCQPGQPQQKPLIERVIRTFQHGQITAMSGYIGNTVAARQKIRARGADQDMLPMTPEQFQAWVDKWCDWYNSNPHSSLLGEAPLNVLHKWVLEKGWVPKMAHDDQLRFLLLSRDVRTVNKSRLRLHNRFYVSPTNDLWEQEGQQVQTALRPRRSRENLCIRRRHIERVRVRMLLGRCDRYQHR
jgi:hypothetical protein